MSRRIALLRGLWISAVMAFGAGALAQSKPPFRYAKVGADGVWVSPLDNPVFDTDFTLATDETANRHNAASVGDYFNYFYFELHLRHVCAAGSQYCAPIKGDRQHPDDGTLCTWPRIVSDWVGDQGVPVEHHGLGIGPEPSTVELRKYRDTVETSLTPSPPSVRLDPSVIVVPVNVIHVMPAASVNAEDAQAAAKYADPAIYRALFDDRWELNYKTVDSEWHRPEYFQGAWYNRSTASFAPPLDFQRSVDSWGPTVLPDDVFAQCGIQFRLQSVTLVPESDPAVINTTLCPKPENTEGYAVRHYRDEWIRKAVLGPGGQLIYGSVIPDALNAVFAPWVTRKVDCNVASVADAGRIAFGYMQNSSLTQNFPELTLAHELGHGLDIDDFTFAGAEKHLMYAYGGPAHLAGCHRRDGAALPELPLGCFPLPDETAAADYVCGIARQGARDILTNISEPGSGWSAMEAPLTPGEPTWTISTGALASFNSSLSTVGNASLEVVGGAYVVASSPVFKTADVPEVGTELGLDVYLQDGQPNPHWLGSVDAFVTIPAAGLYNAYLGHVELTGLKVNQWSSITFPVTDAVRLAMLDDLPIAQIAFAVNTPEGAPAVYLDGLEFTGTLEPRVIPHAGPLAGGASNAFLSFEQAGDWSASNGTASLANEWTEGAHSLGVNGTGWVEILSRTFQTNELPVGVTSTLTVDIKPTVNPPNPYWLGTLALTISCPSANLYNQWVGQQELQHLFQGEFNTLEYKLPPSIVSALASPKNTCTLKLALNVSAGSGQYLFDHIAFH